MSASYVHRRMRNGNRRETPLFVWARTKVVEECISVSVKHEGRRQPFPLSQMAMDTQTMNVDIQYTSWMHSNIPSSGCSPAQSILPRLYPLPMSAVPLADGSGRFPSGIGACARHRRIDPAPQMKTC